MLIAKLLLIFLVLATIYFVVKYRYQIIKELKPIYKVVCEYFYSLNKTRSAQQTTDKISKANNSSSELPTKEIKQINANFIKIRSEIAETRKRQLTIEEERPILKDLERRIDRIERNIIELESSIAKLTESKPKEPIFQERTIPIASNIILYAGLDFNQGDVLYAATTTPRTDKIFKIVSSKNDPESAIVELSELCEGEVAVKAISECNVALSSLACDIIYTGEKQETITMISPGKARRLSGNNWKIIERIKIEIK